MRNSIKPNDQFQYKFTKIEQFSNQMVANHDEGIFVFSWWKLIKEEIYIKENDDR